MKFKLNTYNPLSAMFGFATNEILKIEESFYISYQPSAGDGLFDTDGSKPETALCYKGSFHILSGDFRKEYQAVADTGSTVYEDYEAVFKQHKEDHFCDYSSGSEYA